MTAGVRDLPAWLNVSRGTQELLVRLEALVLKWSPTVNLISRSSFHEIWNRHILDSAQIGVIAGTFDAKWADLGSGGGFPALVLAVMARDVSPESHFTLVESDARKATFLRQAIQTLELRASVVTGRIEEIEPVGADGLTARALAPLTDLLAHGYRHLREGGRAFFPKGAAHRDEIDQANRRWRFGLIVHMSKTDPAAAVLEVTDIELR